MSSYFVTLAGAFLLSVAVAKPYVSLEARQISAVSGYSYTGCYTEPSSVRALTANSYFDDLMTLEKCATACSSYAVFGTEYGRECWVRSSHEQFSGVHPLK